MAAEEIVARARALVGARFRPQGRSREAGFDCIGVAAAAVGGAAVRADYRLRGGTIAEVANGMSSAGLRPVADLDAGDLVAMRAGPEQLHLGVWTGSGLVHADAGLRRVVERPGPPPWPVVGAWRKED